MPAELRALRAWLVWRFEANAAGPHKKPRKVPHYVGGGRRCGEQGSPEDRMRLAGFDEAIAAARNGFDGVGLAMLAENGISALDFDACVDAGIVDPQVQALVANTYSEISPSGKGVRAFVRGALPDRKKPVTGETFGFETFHKSGFVTVTGHALDACRAFGYDDVIAALPASVEQYAALRFGTLDDTPAPVNNLDRALALRSVDDDTIADLRSAVQGIHQDRVEDYDKWVLFGHACKSLEQAGRGADGLELWHSLAKRSDRYDEAECDAKWDTFSPHKITFRSIIYAAQQDGWTNPRSALALKTGDTDAYALLEDRTDTGNVNRLVRRTAGDLRYVPERRLWLWWDGARWLADDFGSYSHAAAQLVAQDFHKRAAELQREAGADLSDAERKKLAASAASVEKWAVHCRNKKAIDAMLALAAKDGRLAVPSAQLDRDPWLFGVANGVVDLRTGQLRAAARDEFVTKRSAIEFDPSAEAARWRQFIAEIAGEPLPAVFDEQGGVVAGTVGRFRERPALAAYLQRAIGYCATGQTSEQKMLIAVGPGSNGKNVLLDIAQEVLGDYCRTIPPAALMTTKGDDAEKPSPIVASLAGSRLAIGSESKDGARLDVALVKRHTGGGYMTARFLHGNPIRFEITHKLVLMTNHKPALDHLDDALRGRLHLVPFDRVWNRPGHSERNDALPDGDKDLMTQLRAELPGILAWIVEGACAYAREGLEPPSEVARMTRAYFSEQDPIARWLDTHQRCEPKQGTGAADLFKSFVTWHRDEDTGDGAAPQTEKAFSEALRSRGIQKVKTKTVTRYGLTSKKVAGGG